MRSVLVGFLVLLLTVNVVAANAAVATERTALNPDFVKSSLEEEGAYESVQTMLADAATEELSGAMPAEDLPISVDEIVTEAITEEYLQDQVESNVDGTLAYLHGNEEELEMSLDLAPVKERVGDAVGDSIREMSVAELLALVTEEGDASVDAMGVTFELSTIDEMAESSEAYEEAREDFRSQIRDAVLDEMVEEAFQFSSNDELLSLVVEDYDPDEYDESEKEAMVDEREDEIRIALRAHIEAEEGDRIDDRIDEQMDAINEMVTAEIDELLADGLDDEDAAVAEPAAAMVGVGVDGLTTDMTYEEYTTELDRAKDDLADNTSAFVVSSMSEEIPDRMDLTEELDPQTQADLESARQAVTWFDRAAAGLPLLSLVFVGLIFGVSRSEVTTAIATGAGLVVAGVVGLVVAWQVPALIGEAVQAGGDDQLGPAIEIVLGFVDRVASTLGVQSLAIAALGIVAIGAGLYLRTYGSPWARDEGTDGAVQ